MAQGDLTLFEETLVGYGEGTSQIDFESDTFKMALLTSAITPTAADAVPAYSGGTTNFNGAGDECTAGGSYTAGGAALANPSWVEAGGTATFDVDDPATWAQNAANPAAAKWALIYDDTTTIKWAIAFIDLGTAFDMTTGDLTVAIAAGGVFQASIQASV